MWHCVCFCTAVLINYEWLNFCEMKDIDLCKELLSEICTTVKSGLPNHWLPTIINLLKRSFVDKISLVALEALMVSEINFHKSLRVRFQYILELRVYIIFIGVFEQVLTY